MGKKNFFFSNFPFHSRNQEYSYTVFILMHKYPSLSHNVVTRVHFLLRFTRFPLFYTLLFYYVPYSAPKFIDSGNKALITKIPHIFFFLNRKFLIIFNFTKLFKMSSFVLLNIGRIWWRLFFIFYLILNRIFVMDRA